MGWSLVTRQIKLHMTVSRSVTSFFPPPRKLFFCIWHSSQFIILLSRKDIDNTVLLRSLEQIVGNWQKEYKITNMPWQWLRFGFQPPKTWCWSYLGSILAVPRHIFLEIMGSWPGIYFSGQRLMDCLRTTIIFPKRLCLRCKFRNLDEMYIFLLFTHLYKLLNNKSMIMPSLGYMFT